MQCPWFSYQNVQFFTTILYVEISKNKLEHPEIDPAKIFRLVYHSNVGGPDVSLVCIRPMNRLQCISTSLQERNTGSTITVLSLKKSVIINSKRLKLFFVNTRFILCIFNIIEIFWSKSWKTLQNFTLYPLFSLFWTVYHSLD